MPIPLAVRHVRESGIKSNTADKMALEIQHAVIMGTGRSIVCWSRQSKAFIAAPLGHHLMKLEDAERVARTVGGAIVDIVVRDTYGPCCYRLEN